MTMGEFKQELLRINNKVNMEVFNQGLLSQRVDIICNRAVITAKNRRVSVLSISENMDRNTTEIMDRILIIRFKQRFLEEMEKHFGIRPLAHLKDYDPELEISISVTLFEKDIEELLPGLQVRETESEKKAGSKAGKKSARNTADADFSKMGKNAIGAQKSAGHACLGAGAD